MERKIKVVFENGGLKPLEPINLQQRQEGFFVFNDESNKFQDIQLVGHLKAVLSEQALAKIWENTADDIYNDV